MPSIRLIYESYVYNKLHEAEIQAAVTSERLSHEDVVAAARQKLQVLEDRRRA